MFQKKNDKNSVKELNEIEISNLPDKELKVIVVKMFTKSGEERIKKGEIQKEVENFKKNQSELKNIIMEMKKIPEGISNRLDDAKHHQQSRRHTIWAAKKGIKK